uniref:NADH dehydrogenase subunit 2 n=1 Tax=Gergithus frontilongus TaxID=2733716 RepID=UPI002E77BD7E|nr:NADH dehydrogenase subunit 2 [Gergithus frontilongus]WQB38504.1 NADH dehydrogenase subunit 2 [Gergithus frontilongus]
MKINLSKMMFITMTMISSIMTMSSNNVMMTWMTMEINMISFMPLMTKSKKMKDQPMKYFIIQSIASSLMLMSMMVNSILESSPSSSTTLLASMLMKMGMIPFHLWMPSTMQKLSWNKCFILSTIQKIPPTIIMTQMMKTNLLIMPMMLSSVLGPMTALKQLSLKKIMAYSSIANSTWIILSMKMSKQMFMIFFLTYSTITMMLMKNMKTNKFNFTNQLNLYKNSKKLSMSMNMMSMSGMPPLLGFFPKWMILQNLINSSMIMSTTMIISSTISTMVYIKMMSTMMMNMSTTKKTKKEKTKKELDLMINLIGIPMMLTTKI